jgi:hypothetical protein
MRPQRSFYQFNRFSMTMLARMSFARSTSMRECLMRSPLAPLNVTSIIAVKSTIHLPAFVNLHGEGQLIPFSSPVRAYHKWYYISKQIDSRISAAKDLDELVELHRVAGKRFTFINHASILMRVARLRRAALLPAHESIVDYQEIPPTSPSSSPTAAAEQSTPGYPEEGTRPSNLQQQPLQPTSPPPVVHAFSTLAPSSSPSPSPSHNVNEQGKPGRAALFLRRICHKTKTMSKWFDPRQASSVVYSLSHLTDPTRPRTHSQSTSLDTSLVPTVDRELSLSVIDEVLNKAARRIQGESFTKDLALVSTVSSMPVSLNPESLIL